MSRSRSSREAAALLVVVLPVICAVAAFQTQTPIFRGGTDVVQIDVSVLDKNRQPVRGLAQEDFTVFEDGKEQAIAAFAPVELPDVVRSTTAWVNEVAPDVTTNEVPNKRVFVIVLDDSSMQLDLAATNSMKQSANSLIDRLGRDDYAAVVFTRSNIHAQDLTNDRLKLKRAVSTLSNLGAENQPTCEAYLWPSQVLQRATDYLNALPQRRKTILFLSGGMAIDLGIPKVVGPIFPPPDAEPCGQRVLAETKDVFRNAQLANVNIYGVDPGGLRASGGLGAASQRVGRGSFVGSPGGMIIEFLQTVSDNTGGHAIINTNDFEPGLAQIFVENSSYYLLGYRPTNVKPDGTMRRLEVKVNRPEVDVRARRFNIAPGPPKPKAVPPPPLLDAIAGLVPKMDLPMRIALAPFAASTGDGATVTVVLGLQRPAQSERAVEEIELLVKAFTPDGEVRGEVTPAPMSLNIPPARRGDTVSRYDLLTEIPAKPGRYRFRVSARSTTLDKVGSVYADVDVPDFVKDPLSFSGAALTVTPGLPVTPLEAFSDIMTIVPTAVREFARFERVTAFVRVYQGGKTKIAPVPVSIRIRDSANNVAVDQTDAIGPERFTKARAADLSVPLPVARLVPGEYLLTFEARLDKATATRDVRFTVK